MLRSTRQGLCGIFNIPYNKDVHITAYRSCLLPTAMDSSVKIGRRANQVILETLHKEMPRTSLYIKFNVEPLFTEEIYSLDAYITIGIGQSKAKEVSKRHKSHDRTQLQKVCIGSPVLRSQCGWLLLGRINQTSLPITKSASCMDSQEQPHTICH